MHLGYQSVVRCVDFEYPRTRTLTSHSRATCHLHRHYQTQHHTQRLSNDLLEASDANTAVASSVAHLARTVANVTWRRASNTAAVAGIAQSRHVGAAFRDIVTVLADAASITDQSHVVSVSPHNNCSTNNNQAYSPPLSLVFALRLQPDATRCPSARSHLQALKH